MSSTGSSERSVPPGVQTARRNSSGSPSTRFPARSTTARATEYDIAPSSRSGFRAVVAGARGRPGPSRRARRRAARRPASRSRPRSPCRTGSAAAARRSADELAGERLAEAASSGKKIRRSGFAVSSVTRPASSSTSPPGRSAAGGRWPSRSARRARPAAGRAARRRSGARSWSVSASGKTTTSPRATESERHIASPFPTAGPNAGSSSSSWWTSSPCARGHLGGAVLGGRVDRDHLVDQRRLLVERMDLVGDRPDRLPRPRGRAARPRPDAELALAPRERVGVREVVVLVGRGAANQSRTGGAERWSWSRHGPLLLQAACPGRATRKQLPGRPRRSRSWRARTSASSRPRTSSRRKAALCPIPDELHPQVREALERTGIDVALLPPGGRLGERHAPRPHDRHDRDRERQVALLQPAGAAHAVVRPPGAGALPLSDQGARPGPGAQPRGAADPAAAARDLRRRHAAARSARRSASASNLVLTNPDMLHVGILPHHDRWGTSSPTSRSWSWTRRTSTAASSARTSPTCCGGCGGSPHAYGTSPRFVLTSATIANPVELAEGLTGLEFGLVDRDGAPRGEREIVMCNPPLLDERTGQARIEPERGGRAVRRPRRRATCARSASRAAARGPRS